MSLLLLGEIRLPYHDLAQAVADPQVQVGPVDDVDEAALRLPPGRGDHGVVGPQNCHLWTSRRVFDGTFSSFQGFRADVTYT